MLDSPLSTYSDTTPQMRIVTDEISIMTPANKVKIETLGGLDGAMDKFRFVTWPGTNPEWLEDTLAPLTDSIDGTLATATTAVTVDDASPFQPGDVVLVTSELMWVSAVNYSTEILTVTRNFGGTQSTHADDIAIEKVGQARLEGDDSDQSNYTDRTSNSNYTQIFHKEIKVNRSQNQIRQYGIAEEFEYQADKVVPEKIREIERWTIQGVRKAGSATTPRSFGGFSVFITDNSISAGGAVTQADFDNLGKLMYDDGGEGPWDAYVSPANMIVIKNFLDSGTYLRVTLEDHVVGMKIEAVNTPFGLIRFVLDRYADDATIYVVNPRNAGYATFYPFTRELLAKTGDSMKGEVVGEYTLCVRQDKSHGYIGAIS